MNIFKKIFAPKAVNFVISANLERDNTSQNSRVVIKGYYLMRVWKYPIRGERYEIIAKFKTPGDAIGVLNKYLDSLKK